MAEDLKSAVYDYLLVNCVNPLRWFSEREIAEALQVTRSSVREVLLFMEGEGVVSKVPQRGYRCVDYSNGDVRAMELLRFVLEHAAVMKAMTAARTADLEMLKNIIRKMDQAFEERNEEEYMLADMKFHTVLIEASHDALMIKLFSVMKLALYGRTRRATLTSESMKRTHIIHHKLYDAFIARDFPEVEKMVCEHIGGVANGSNIDKSAIVKSMLLACQS